MQSQRDEMSVNPRTNRIHKSRRDDILPNGCAQCARSLPIALNELNNNISQISCGPESAEAE